jgi:hypothetical protein
MRTRIAIVTTLLCALTATATASSTVFTSVTPGVEFAVNDIVNGVDAFQVSPSSLTTANAYAKNDGSSFQLSAESGSFDAGLVLYFQGGLKLGDLQSVSVQSNNPSWLNVNLWLDTGGNGQFFAFSGTTMTSLDGDSYASTPGASVGATSLFTMVSGNGAGGTDTLAQLQAGKVAGIGANTAMALWIGGSSGTAGGSATITSITVQTYGAAPEPASLSLLTAGILAIGVAAIRKRRG